ncbi:alpha/beta hydrolase [Nonomuraea sp. NPDC050663]|uniref:alpha/beta hydrolase n=1 Tax=Nonomuraea sp. NPDC050663 TaxID=3364370 RepID=UPI0037B653FA
MTRADVALAAGCEPAVVEWVRDAEGIAATLPDLASPDARLWRKAATVLSDELARRYTLPAPEDCRVTEHLVPTRDGQVTVLRYQAPGGSGPRPARLSLHGGGFILGSVREEVNHRMLSAMTVEGGWDHFDVDYRLAPDHPFPAALHDSLDVLAWLIGNAADLDVDPRRVGVVGTSAGGNLAAMVAVHARDVLHHQILNVPMTTMDLEGDASYQAYAALEGSLDLAALRRMYQGPEETAMPMTADLTGLPPALVITAEADPLRDSGEAYAVRLGEAGVDVTHWRAPGQAHGSCSLTRTSAIAREWQSRLAQYTGRN